MGGEHTATPSRRDLLAGLTGSALGVGLAGCTSGGSDGGDGGDGADGGDGEAGASGGGSCTPGHTDGDPACRQIADDGGVLTGFDAAGTALPVTFDYPCGWNASTTDQFDDRAQANATRSEIGDENGYVDVQVRAYYEAVSEGFLDAKKQDGNYDEVDYEYDGGTRRGLVSAESNARFGTLAHAVVPVQDSLVHVELASTLQASSCDVEPRPDYGIVTEMFRSLEPNPDTSFSVSAAGGGAAGGSATSTVDELQVAGHEHYEPRGSDPDEHYAVLLTISNAGDSRTDLSEYSYEFIVYDDAGTDITPRGLAKMNWDEPAAGASGEITLQHQFRQSSHSPADVARYEITLSCDTFDDGVYCDG